MSDHPFLPRTIRRLSVPILLLWLALAATTNALVRQLEELGRTHNVAMNLADAPSLQATKRIGLVFGEFDSDSAAMVVLEGDKPLGADAHRFCDTMIHRLEQDRKHVKHVQDFWGDTLTAAASQSADGEAAYVQVYLAETWARRGPTSPSTPSARSSSTRRRRRAARLRHRRGTAHRGSIRSGQQGNREGHRHNRRGDRGDAAVRLPVFVTMILVLVTVLIEMAAARRIVALLGSSGIIGLSTYSTNLLTFLVIAAGTDYAIFVVGRYQEARGAGENRETAFYTMFRSMAHIALGSGLTVAGAVFCLSFTRLPYFQSLGVPAALGILLALAAALILGPAVLTLGVFFGLVDPKRAMRTRGWRRIGTAVVPRPATTPRWCSSPLPDCARVNVWRCGGIA